VAAATDLILPEINGPLYAFADPLRVRQVIRNLITNARRYGGPTVRLDLSRVGEDMVSVSVVDDGLGVPPGSEQMIFEAYVSVHDQAGQPGSVGLGLALALSLSMAHMMGGDLSYSRRGDETWFTLTLPTPHPPNS